MINYNLRVYAIIVDEENRILLSSESHGGIDFVKFPGGGHQFGESLQESVKREIKEELQLDSDVRELFYFNEFSQFSAFDANQQLFSFYYKLTLKDSQSIQWPLNNGHETFFWAKIDDINQEVLRFPIDKIVLELAQKFWNNAL